MKTIQREVQVAFSPRVQPWWFRLIKWSMLIAITVRYRKRRWFPYAMSSAFMGGIALHLFYRYKTQGWTQAWGGWDDIAADEHDGADIGRVQ
jgi:hypothetical protein